MAGMTSDNYNVNIQKYGNHLFAISDMAGEKAGWGNCCLKSH